jgi:hypothetical protein
MRVRSGSRATRTRRWAVDSGCCSQG